MRFLVELKCVAGRWGCVDEGRRMYLVLQAERE